MADDLADRLRRLQSGPDAGAPPSMSLEDRLALMQGRDPQEGQPPGAPITGGRAFGRAGVTSFLDNLLGLPDVAANMVREGGQMPPSVTRMFNPMETVRDVKALFGGPAATNEMQNARTADDSAFYGREQSLGARNLGLPRGDQVVAAALALPGGPGGLTDRYQGEIARGQQLREEHPIASTVGDLTGDAATLFTGRMPGVNAMGRAEKVIAGLKNPIADPGFRRVAMEVMTSDAMKGVYRGLGRAAETSLEGAGLAILKEGDPIDTALYGAAGQVGGSIGLGMGKAVWKHPLWATVLGSAAVYQVAKDMTPGGRDRILESLESGSSHAAHALMIGAVSGMVGAGRIRSADLPRVADAMTAIPRGAMLSLLSDMSKEEEAGGADVRNTVAHLVNNPDGFNKTQIGQLERAMTEGTLGDTIGKMVKTDPRFREIIDTDPSEAAASAEAERVAEERRRALRKRLDESRSK